MFSSLMNHDFVSLVMPQNVKLEYQEKYIIQVASKRLWSMKMKGWWWGELLLHHVLVNRLDMKSQ